MKQIQVWFEDAEHKKLVDVKNNLSWHDFIMKLVEMRRKEKGSDAE